MSDAKTHREAHMAIRAWRAEQVGAQNGENLFLRKLTRSYILEVPGQHGFPIHVVFSEVEGLPDVIRIGATNWAAEYEPRGFFRAEDARKFYRQLKQLGMEEPK